MKIDLTKLQERSYQTRAEVSEGRTITAIGVPYGQRIDLGAGYFEEIMPGAVQDEGAILRYEHREPLGRIEASEDTDAGRQITAIISDTARGRDVQTLLADGVLTKMSVGFWPVEYDVVDLDEGQTLIRHTKINAVEYSVVEFPAFSEASITEVRSKNNQAAETLKENHMDKEMLERLALLERKLDTFEPEKPAAPALDTRSIGDVLKAVASRDESTIEQVNTYQSRAYQGGTTADDGALTPTWVKDLTRIIIEANPIASLFSTGTLPAEGMQLEFTRLKANTIKVGKQAAEGDALPTGKVSVESASTPIETFGGASSLSFQEIQRTRTNMLTLTMQALARAAGLQARASFTTFYQNVVKQQIGNAITSSANAGAIKWPDLLAMSVDANAAYRDLALPLDGLILDKKTFLAIASLTTSDGAPLMEVTGKGRNTIGSISADKLQGELAGLTIVPDFDSKLTDAVGAFYSSQALRVYTSGIAHLQDEAILNLTRDVAVYYYAAHADEIPAGIIPLKLGAA